MKTKILLTVAAASVFSLVASANGGETLLSPRAKEQRDSVRTVAGTTSDTIDRSLKPVSPREADRLASLRIVPNTGPITDFVHAPRPLMSPKDPRFELAWRQNGQVEIAPVK